MLIAFPIVMAAYTGVHMNSCTSTFASRGVQSFSVMEHMRLTVVDGHAPLDRTTLLSHDCGWWPHPFPDCCGQ